MNDTPASTRLHIALFGRCNSGKSSLVNALTGQDTSLVSSTPGTTTDPVTKAMEVHPLGPCLFIDTPGFDDDESELGAMRVNRTLKMVERTDIALLLCEDGGDYEQEWVRLLTGRNIPVIPLLNKSDILPNAEERAQHIAKCLGESPVIISAKEGTGIQRVLQAILEKLPEDFGSQTITGNLVEAGDVVLLVMPQDIQAPKGRLILPQVQTLRELLDKKCLILSCTTDQLPAALQSLAHPPKLIITDSQALSVVSRLKPAESRLTSFSILFARYKGDIDYFTGSASAIDTLTEHSRVLIAEACTHAPLTEDIGRVKLPRLLRSRVGEHLQIDIVSGSDFPQDLSVYNLIIHCGACMFNRKHVLSRVASARAAGVPMTNYGIAIAHLSGVQY